MRQQECASLAVTQEAGIPPFSKWCKTAKCITQWLLQWLHQSPSVNWLACTRHMLCCCELHALSVANHSPKHRLHYSTGNETGQPALLRSEQQVLQYKLPEYNSSTSYQSITAKQQLRIITGLMCLQVVLLDPVQYPGAMKAFAREVCRNDLLNFGRLHFFFPDSRMSLDLNTDKTLKVTPCSCTADCNCSLEQGVQNWHYCVACSLPTWPDVWHAHCLLTHMPGVLLLTCAL